MRDYGTDKSHHAKKVADGIFLLIPLKFVYYMAGKELLLKHISTHLLINLKIYIKITIIITSG
jgi:hypothetical protein